MTVKNSARMISKVDNGAVSTAQLTARDSVDSVGCPPLGTFQVDKNGQRSSNVDSDAVNAVSALSTSPADSVGGLRWGPLSAFAPPIGAPRPPVEGHRGDAVDAVNAPACMQTLAPPPIDMVRKNPYYLCEPKPQVGQVARSAIPVRGPPC